MEIECLIHEDAIGAFFENVERPDKFGFGFGCIMVEEFPTKVHGLDVSNLKMTIDTVAIVAAKTVGSW